MSNQSPKVLLQHLRGFTVQILGISSRASGTGFVVSTDGKVVTCAHVVRAVLGVEPRNAGDQELVVRFTRTPRRSAETRRAKVTAYFSDYDDDVALLQLTDGSTPLAANEVAALGNIEDSFENSFRSYGFRPLGDYPAGIADGEIEGYVDSPVEKSLLVDPVQLQSSNISGGMSGAPILDKERNLVVGVITTSYYPDPNLTKDRDTAWAVDAYVLSQDPFNLPMRHEPLPLGDAPQPKIDVSMPEVATAPDVAIVLYGAPAPSNDDVWPEDLSDSLSYGWANSERRISTPIGFDHRDKRGLVRNWIDELLEDPLQPQPNGVFWWSFDKNSNVNDFFGAALNFMGVGRAEPTSLPSANLQAQFVGGMLSKKRYLFILDGLERMQHQDEENYGLLTNTDLRDLLRFFAAPGHESFCLVITDIPVVDLVDYATYALPPIQSSRDSLAGAGWACQEVGSYSMLIPFEARERPFTWIRPLKWWAMRNELFARFAKYPVNEVRRSWVTYQRQLSDVSEDFIIDRSDLSSVKFLVIGNTGDGDEAQFALVPPLVEHGKDTQFMLIRNDIYPPGDTKQYLHKFYIPYKNYPKPIYALPGNYEWYDALNSFMVHFCGAESSGHQLERSRMLRHLWRKPAKIEPEVLEKCRTFRPEPEERLKQPGPYFAIDSGPLLLVCVDTGLTGQLDREQGEWLRWVSREILKPKILFTSKPIYVNAEYHPGSIEGGGSIDEIVRVREHNYVAAIGGGTHNYQRYPVNVEGRVIQYIVSGGGGGLLGGTHTIPKVKLPGIDENDFRCYPLRGDSFSFFSRLFDRRFFFGRGRFEINPSEAAALVGERLGIAPARRSARQTPTSGRSRKVAESLYSISTAGDFFRPVFSLFFDWSDPPFFNSFLQVEATAGELTITCYGITGCREHEKNPPVEDQVKIHLA